MKQTKENILERVGALIGTDDDALTLLEDITDSIVDESEELAAKVQEVADLTEKVTALETEKEQIEASWREKYKARFLGGAEAEEEEEEEEEKTYTYEELFKEGE